MKLQTKLSLVLLAGLLSVYLGSSVFQYYRNSTALGKFSKEISAAEEGDHWGWVERLQDATYAPLIGAMAEGEMDKFEKLLASQRTVRGLQELSLFDARGRTAYSSDPARLKQRLPEELKAQLMGSAQIIKRRTDESFEIYRSVPAAKSCIECHTDWKENEVCGVMSMKFSTATLKAAEKSWVDFERNLNKSNASTSMMTAVVLVIALGLLIGVAIHFQLTRPLKQVADALNAEAEQVGNAASQLSAQSQSLAEGASEQAASLEETSASLEQLASTTKNNADHAQQAKDIASATHHAAKQGVANMRQMNAAMSAIRAAGDDISKIIKTIDEIAFQTNILALNAAVEAARAGEAGMGFAVVADEVRNLAQRSAQAAKETAAKIEGAITKTGQGVEISGKVAQALNVIVAKVRQVDELVAEVSGASREQTLGITQINTAVGQMDKVTQSNAANAEESAAAAEELNAQAETMKESVAELLKLVGGANQTSLAQAPETAPDRRRIHSVVPAVKLPVAAHGNDRRKSVSSTPAHHDHEDLVQWDEAQMTTGVDSIDEQHQELIKMINELHRACLAGAGKEELRRMMSFLAVYVQTHFKHEEGLMDQHRCPSKGANKAAHMRFLQTFGELNQNFEAHGPTTSMLLDLRTLVGDWLKTHICSVDTKLRQCPSALSGRLATLQGHQ